MTSRTLSLVAGGLALAAGTAQADEGALTRGDEAKPDTYSYAWTDPTLASQIGVGVAVGGGIGGFTDESMIDSTSDVGGLWDVRAQVGTHTPIGVDVTYLGTAANLSSFEGADNGSLVGTTVEAALRYNVLPHSAWNPYVFAGAGWQRYDVVDPKLAQSATGLSESDDIAVFPMGVGIGYRNPAGIIADLRGTFRAATDSTLLLDQRDDTYADLHTWQASASLGYEF